MKVGRNDPCPCGSGKKYKKCCLAKDEAVERESFAQIAATKREVAQAFAREPLPERPSLPFPPLPEPPPPPPPDPLDVARDELWEAFEAADTAEQLALFLGALADQEVLDAELAFDMLTRLQGHPNRADFAQAIEALIAQRPELYQHDLPYYLDWQITNALATGDLAALPALGATLATTAGKHLDNFFIALDRLAYHGQLAVAAQIMAQAWPYVSASQDLLPWATQRFARRAMDLTLFARLEQSPDLRPDDPALMAALQMFSLVVPEHVTRYITFLNGQAAHSWSLNDFVFGRRVRRDKDDQNTPRDPAVEHVDDLTLAFLGALYRDGVSLGKGNLARLELAEYFSERHAGKLKPIASPFERARPKGSKPPRAERYKPVTTHPLCPDRDTLDRFLGGLLGFMSTQGYAATATVELLPAWLRFLEECGLLTAEQHAATLDDLRPLIAENISLWEQRTGDPAVVPNVQLAWERA